jgi:hypothetical protein
VKRRRIASAALTGFYAGFFALVLNGVFVMSFYGAHWGKAEQGEQSKKYFLVAEQPGSTRGLSRKEFATAENKIDLPVTVIEQTAPEVVSLSDTDQEVDLPVLERTSAVDGSPVEAEETEETPGGEFEAEVADASLPEGVPAMLRARGNGPEIGNFKSVTIQGDAEECLAIGQSIAGSVKGSALEVMVTSRQITIAKICANNGVIFFTCRAGQVSISPRRSRPDNRCAKNAA